MQYDGSVWINTKIDSDGMVKGFDRIKNSAGDVAKTVQKVGTVIEDAFAVAGDSTAVKKACDSLGDLTKSFADLGKQLEKEKQKLATLKEDYAYLSEQLDVMNNPSGTGFDMDLDTYLEYSEALKTIPEEIKKQEAEVERLERQWQKSSEAIEKAVSKVTETVKTEMEKQSEVIEDASPAPIAEGFAKAGTSAEKFGGRLRKLAAAAFVFNIIRKGLSTIVSYFGSALMANNNFANAVNRLKGSLQVAFQPIYETILPALIKLVEWLNVAVQAVGRFFAALTGKSYSQMQKNAQSLNNAMNGTDESADNAADSVEDVKDAIKDTGKEAKKAEKYLAGFDEINRMLKDDTDDLSDSLEKVEDVDYGNLASGNNDGSIFEEVKLPEALESAIEKLALRFKDIFFEWENLNAEVITEKLLAALMAIGGGLLGFSLLGGSGALIGIAVGAALAVVLSAFIFDGDGKLSAQEILQSLIAVAGVIGGGLIGFSIGGPLGGLIGATVGAALTILLSKVVFDEDGSISASELVKSLGAIVTFLTTLGAVSAIKNLGGINTALTGIKTVATSITKNVLPVMSTALAAIKTGLGSVVSWFTNTLIPAASGAITAIATALGLTVGQFVAIAAAIAVAIALVVIYWDEIKNFFTVTFPNALKQAGEWIHKKTQEIALWFSDLKEKIKGKETR